MLTQQANDETSDINYSKFRDPLRLLVLQGQKSTHGKTRNARDYSVGNSMHAASKHSSNPITAKKLFEKVVLKLAFIMDISVPICQNPSSSRLVEQRYGPF